MAAGAAEAAEDLLGRFLVMEARQCMGPAEAEAAGGLLLALFSSRVRLAADAHYTPPAAVRLEVLAPELPEETEQRPELILIAAQVVAAEPRIPLPTLEDAAVTGASQAEAGAAQVRQQRDREDLEGPEARAELRS